MLHELMTALEETLFMVFASGLLTWIIGLPLGILLGFDHLNKTSFYPTWFYKSIKSILYLMRSPAFLILMLITIPLIHFFMRHLDGILLAIIPLTLAAIPHFSHFTEKSIRDIPKGLIEASEAVGATRFQIIYKVILPEALPNIILGLTQTLNQLVTYSVIAGILSGGGLGGLMVEKDQQGFLKILLLSAALIIILMEGIQLVGRYAATNTK